MKIKAPAVAGTFYPLDAHELNQVVENYLSDNPCQHPAPRILVVPHAGFAYSAAIAARAYNTLHSIRHQIQRVVILGPNHWAPLNGIAGLSSDCVATPLGNIGLDRAAMTELERVGLIQQNDGVHRLEHCLEVQLPFLQCVLPHFTAIPLLVGDTPPQQVTELLEQLFEPHTLIVISSDLSHYQNYSQAKERDGKTCEQILDRDYHIEAQQACGFNALNGALLFAKRRDLQVHLLDLCNSGDTAGDRSQVVGYASFSIH